MLRDRCVQTVVFALLAIGLIGVFEPGRASTSTGVSHTRLQPMQLQWGSNFDLVLAGDSRVQHGISPLEIQKVFPGRRIANFGFAGLTFDTEYLDRAEQLLDRRAAAPVIVLGVSPASLCPRATQKFQEQVARTDTWSARVEYRFAPLVDFFAPYRNIDFKYMLLGGTQLETVVHPSGFCATRSLGPVNTQLVVGGYRRLFSRTQAAPAIQQLIVNRVGNWTEAGIRVFGVRVPTAPNMRALEDSASGFDEDAFAAQFRRAGGIWLDISQDGYASYDGSHLEVASAEAFTRTLCQQLRSHARPLSPEDVSPYRLAVEPETRQYRSLH